MSKIQNIPKMSKLPNIVPIFTKKKTCWEFWHEISFKPEFRPYDPRMSRF